MTSEEANVDNSTFFWTLGILLGLVLIGIAYRRFGERPQALVTIPEDSQAGPSQSTYKTIKFQPAAPFSDRSRRLDAQSLNWQERMRDHGKRLRDKQVSGIFFAHGTFVGLDPFSVARGIQAVFPRIGDSWIRKIQHLNRKQSNIIMRDLANFLPEYVALTESALGTVIPCREFRWSSGNHHAARLAGALDLIVRIGKFVTESSPRNGQRILLLGHSHAGQVFALFSHLLENTKIGQELIEIIEKSPIFSTDFLKYLPACRHVSVDFVTLGSPVIYPWPERSANRLMHVVNHRGHPYLAGRRRGAPFTLDGDYVQQWGITGSDFLAMTPSERRTNQALDKILGEGLNRSRWSTIRRNRTRVSPHGFTYLVDYADQSTIGPNFLATIFGHGIYTRFDVLEFNMDLICEHFF
jgi:hypothetical protein